MPTLSDCHCLLDWSILADFNTSYSDVNQTKLSQIDPGFVWTNESPTLFKLAMSSVETQNCISKFLKTDIQESQESIDSASMDLSNIITKAAEKSLKRRMVLKRKKQHKRWFDKDLQCMRNRLTNYGKIFTKFPHDPSVRGHFYKLHREYCKLRKFKCKQYKQGLLSKIESLYEKDPKEYWKLIDELKCSPQNDSASAVPPHKWLSHFEKLNKPKLKFQDRLIELQNKLAKLEQLTNTTELDLPITESEISSAIFKLKSSKSPGLDHISNGMIKHGHFTLLPSIHKLFNKCLTYGLYPDTWKIGYIRPLHKNGDVSDPGNYRGISVTNALGKLFNKVLDNRLDKFLSNHNIIDNCQIGFTRKARTTDHIFILKTLIDKYCKSKGDKLYTCFVDFQKAFDTVIHTGIKIKLIELGISSKFYSIVKNLYASSKSCIRVGDNLTEFFPINMGVKQGDNLSPNLFKIFINDLPKYFHSAPDPVYVNNTAIHCLMYADDIVLLSSSPSGLQHKLNRLTDYCKDWCLNVNTSKTKVLIFNKSGKFLNQKFEFDQVTIDCVQEFKYLGIKLSASGSLSAAQDELYQKAMKAYFKLGKDFLSLYPGIKNCLHVFDHTIKPILLYGSEIWGTFNTFTSKFRNKNPSIEEIYAKIPSEKLHIKFCKLILGVHKKSTNFACLSELGRFPLHFNIVLSMVNYWYRLENLQSSFPLLSGAYTESKLLHEAKVPSWFGSINTILEKIKGLRGLANVKYIRFKALSQNCIREHYIHSWGDQIIKCSTGKLCTYSKFKTKFGPEPYLFGNLNFANRRSLTRLRISCHRLNIELGRYKSIPRPSRTCLRCSSGEIDDEVHFLLKCDAFSTKRKSLLDCILKTCMNFSKLADENKLQWLMVCENEEILHNVCDFIIESGI